MEVRFRSFSRLKFALNHVTSLPLLIGFEFWEDKDNMEPCDTPLKSTAAASPGLHHIRYKKTRLSLLSIETLTLRLSSVVVSGVVWSA